MKLNGVDDDESDIFYVLKQNTNKRLLKINNCAADESYVYMSVCCFCRYLCVFGINSSFVENGNHPYPKPNPNPLVIFNQVKTILARASLIQKFGKRNTFNTLQWLVSHTLEGKSELISLSKSKFKDEIALLPHGVTTLRICDRATTTRNDKKYTGHFCCQLPIADLHVGLLLLLQSFFT